MQQRPRLYVLTALVVWASACSSDHAAAPLPPAPPAPPVPAAPSIPAAAQPAEPAAPALAAPPTRSEPASDARSATKQARPVRSVKSSAPPRARAPTPPPKPVAASTPPKVAAPAPAKPAGKVSVPSTAHVRIEVPSALQADLDRDPRMQPWVNQVMTVLDRCYAESARGGALAGSIEVVVTMHENERPDADIKQLPPQLSPIVACATGGLMRTKMPLFTGAEGARRSVRIVFK